jgi:hypothetical protein
MEETKKPAVLTEILSSYWKGFGATLGALTAFGLFSMFAASQTKQEPEE